MSDSFGAAKPGKTGSSSDVTAQRRKLAIAKTYNNQPLNRLFKGASGVITLGSINSTFQTQNNVANIASDTQIVTVSSSVTGMVYGEYRISGTYGGDADIDAILEMISACTGIPVSNLTVTVRAGSIILAWSTITPVPLKIVKPIQTQVALIKQYSSNTSIPGLQVISEPYVSGFINVSVNNSIPLTTTATSALPNQVLALSATDTTITIGDTGIGAFNTLVVLPGNNGATQITVPPDHILRNILPNSKYIFLYGNGVGCSVTTASTPTLTQVGQDISVTGLLPAPTSYIYSTDSGLTWYQLTNNTIIATSISAYTVQIMVDPTSQTPNVLYGISTTSLNVTLHSVLQTPVYKPDELSPLKATFEITNNFLFGYTYILTIEDTTDYTTSQATTIESQGTYIVDGLAQGHKYTAALVMKDSAGTPRAWSTLIEFLTPPPPPIFILNGNKITITNTDNTPGASYNYSITPGISNTPSTGSIGGGATIELTSYTIIPGTIYSLQIGVRLNSVTTLSLPAYALGGSAVYDSVTHPFPPAYTAMYPVSVSGVLVGGGQAGPRVQPVSGQSARVWFGGGGGSTLVIPSSKPLMIPASKTLSVALGAGGAGTTPNWTDMTVRDPNALGIYGGITSLTIEDYGIFQAPCINTVPPPANFTQNVVLYPGTITPLNIDGPFGGAQAFDYDPSKFGGGGVRITTDGAQMPGKSGYYSLTLTPFTLLNPTIQATSATSLTITSITVVPGITYTYIILPSPSSGSSGTITSSNTLITGIDPTVSYSILVTGTLGERIVAQSGELKITSTSPPIDFGLLMKPMSTPALTALTVVPGSSQSLLITNIDNYGSSPGYGWSYSYALSTAPTTWIPVPTGETRYTITSFPYATKYSVQIRRTIPPPGVLSGQSTHYSYSPTSNIVVPTEIPKPTTPVLSQIAKSYTSLRLTNIDKNSLLSYSYSTDNGVTWKSIPKNAVSFTITGLLPSTTYTASVRAKSGGLFSTVAVSNSATTPGISRANRPTLSTISKSYNSLQITNIDNVTGISYSYALNTAPTTWIPLPKGVISYTVTGLLPDTTYYVNIRANVGTSIGLPSMDSNTAIITIPSTPVLGIASSSYTTLQITNIDNVGGYTYSYALNTAPTTWIPLPQGITSYTLTGLVVGQQYSVAIQARDASGKTYTSTFSNIVTTGTVTTPTLTQTSYTSLQITNIDSVVGYTYSYALNTAPTTWIPFPQGTTTSYTLTGLVVGQEYSVGIQARNPTGNLTYSQFSNVLALRPSTPILTVDPSSYLTLIVGNIDTVAGYTYEYSMDGATYSPVSAGSSQIKVTPLAPGTEYTAYIRAKSATNVVLTSLSSNSVTLPNPPGTLTFTWPGNSIPTAGFTLTQPMFLMCTIAGAQGPTGVQRVYTQKGPYFITGGSGGVGTTNTTNIKLSTGMRISANTPRTKPPEYPAYGDDCIFTIYNNNDTLIEEIRGGGGGFGAELTTPGDWLTYTRSGVFSIPVDTLNISKYFIDSNNNSNRYFGIASNGQMVQWSVAGDNDRFKTKDGYYTIKLVPETGLILKTPTLSLIPGSYTSLTVGNMDTMAGHTYYYSLDNGMTYTLLSGSTITGLVFNTTYSVTLQVKDGSGKIVGTTYPSTNVTISITKPSTPTLNRISGSTTSLLLGNVDNTQGFTYFYRLNTQPPGTRTAISTLTPSPSGSGYILSGLVDKQPYSIGITAGNSGFYGPESIFSNIITTTPIPTPSKPTNVFSLSAGPEYIYLLYDIDPLPGYTYYYHLNTDPPGYYTPVDSGKYSGNTYRTPNLRRGQQISISIRAGIGGAYSEDSPYSNFA